MPPSLPVTVPKLTMRTLLPAAEVTIPSLTPTMLPVLPDHDRPGAADVQRVRSGHDSPAVGDEGARDAGRADGVESAVGGDPGVLADIQQELAAAVGHGPVGAGQRPVDRDQRRAASTRRRRP